MQFEEVCPGEPRLGKACILPWDTEIFGFPVACYHTGTDQLDRSLSERFSEHFPAWAERNRVSLCSCSVPAASSFWKCYLPQVHFSFVDFGLRAALNGLQTTALPEARIPVCQAGPEDREAVEAIAVGSFHHGRYHADPLFPRELADLRYRCWARNALAGKHPFDRVFVIGEPGQIQGFYHVTIEGAVSDLRLAAVLPELQGTLVGFDLYASVLHLLKQSGVRRVFTSVSAANTGVMNVYSMLGFRFSAPEAIYHWHSPETRRRPTE